MSTHHIDPTRERSRDHTRTPRTSLALGLAMSVAAVAFPVTTASAAPEDTTAEAAVDTIADDAVDTDTDFGASLAEVLAALDERAVAGEALSTALHNYATAAGISLANPGAENTGTAAIPTLIPGGVAGLSALLTEHRESISEIAVTLVRDSAGGTAGTGADTGTAGLIVTVTDTHGHVAVSVLDDLAPEVADAIAEQILVAADVIVSGADLTGREGAQSVTDALAGLAGVAGPTVGGDEVAAGQALTDAEAAADAVRDEAVENAANDPEGSQNVAVTPADAGEITIVTGTDGESSVIITDTATGAQIVAEPADDNAETAQAAAALALTAALDAAVSERSVTTAHELTTALVEQVRAETDNTADPQAPTSAELAAALTRVLDATVQTGTEEEKAQLRANNAEVVAALQRAVVAEHNGVPFEETVPVVAELTVLTGNDQASTLRQAITLGMLGAGLTEQATSQVTGVLAEDGSELVVTVPVARGDATGILPGENTDADADSAAAMDALTQALIALGVLDENARPIAGNNTAGAGNTENTDTGNTETPAEDEESMLERFIGSLGSGSSNANGESTVGTLFNGELELVDVAALAAGLGILNSGSEDGLFGNLFGSSGSSTGSSNGSSGSSDNNTGNTGDDDTVQVEPGQRVPVDTAPASAIPAELAATLTPAEQRVVNVMRGVYGAEAVEGVTDQQVQDLMDQAGADATAAMLMETLAGADQAPAEGENIAYEVVDDQAAASGTEPTDTASEVGSPQGTPTGGEAGATEYQAPTEELAVTGSASQTMLMVIGALGLAVAALVGAAVFLVRRRNAES